MLNDPKSVFEHFICLLVTDTHTHTVLFLAVKFLMRWRKIFAEKLKCHLNEPKESECL